MWHKVESVAKNFRLDPVELVKFGRQNMDKFHLTNFVGNRPHGQLMVSTFNTDDLVREFKQAQENFERARQHMNDAFGE